MSDVNVRLECLKLAAGTTREVGEMVARAKTFEEYVTSGSQPAGQTTGGDLPDGSGRSARKAK